MVNKYLSADSMLVQPLLFLSTLSRKWSVSFRCQTRAKIELVWCLISEICFVLGSPLYIFAFRRYWKISSLVIILAKSIYLTSFQSVKIESVNFFCLKLSNSSRKSINFFFESVKIERGKVDRLRKIHRLAF